MMWVQVVLGLLVGEGPEETRQRRRGRVVVVVVVGLIALLGLAGTGWVVAQASMYGWQTGDWDRLWAAGFLPYPFLFALFLLPLVLLALNIAPSSFTQPLRELVASGDMRVSYPGVIQPQPLLPQEVALGAQNFQRLRVTEGQTTYRRFFGMAPGLVVAAMAALENLPHALGWNSTDWASWLFLPMLLGGLGLMIGVMIWQFIWLIRLAAGPRTRLSITTDEQGVRWQRGKRGHTQRMDWHAVRSFSVMVYEDTSGLSSRCSTFLVDGGDALLAWTLYSGSGPDEYGESWQLSRQIVTHSGQLLRDLTPLTASLRVTRAKPNRLRAIGAPEPLITATVAAKRRLRRIWLIGVPLLIVLMAVLFAPPVSSGIVRDHQKQYFAGLVPKIHAGKQLYHNALTADDSEWLTLTPGVADDQMSLGVVDGAYQMSAPKGQFADWTISPVFRDMAVEVTMRLSGPATDSSGAGLVLRSTYAVGNMVVFYVDPFDGSWSLAHYVDNGVNSDSSWHTLNDGTSSAIVRGDGAENTLLALARGDVIVLYINGHFVASYSAQDHLNDNNYDAPPMIYSGYVGVYDNEGSDMARFNDFTVYAITSPPSLEYA
ncbi:MAG: hypothetical protein ACXWQR_14660 [Ktedonobacterales bacterium]